MNLKKHPAVRGDRVVLSGEATSLGDFGAFDVPSKNFVLLVAADTRDEKKRDMVEAAQTLIRAGASYVCCWGPDCKRFHDCFDEADQIVNGEGKTERTVVTTWHKDEPLEEAVWFAVTTAWPSYAYELTTGAVIALSIGSPEWASRITRYLDAGARPRDA